MHTPSVRRPPPFIAPFSLQSVRIPESPPPPPKVEPDRPTGLRFPHARTAITGPTPPKVPMLEEKGVVGVVTGKEGGESALLRGKNSANGGRAMKKDLPIPALLTAAPPAALVEKSGREILAKS